MNRAMSYELFSAGQGIATPSDCLIPAVKPARVAKDTVQRPSVS